MVATVVVINFVDVLVPALDVMIVVVSVVYFVSNVIEKF